MLVSGDKWVWLVGVRVFVRGDEWCLLEGASGVG